MRNQQYPSLPVLQVSITKSPNSAPPKTIALVTKDAAKPLMGCFSTAGDRLLAG